MDELGKKMKPWEQKRQKNGLGTKNEYKKIRHEENKIMTENRLKQKKNFKKINGF